MKSKNYKCEIESCGRSVAIRSTLKEGDNKGKKVCPSCKQRLEGKAKPLYKINPFTDKAKEKRQTERAGLPVFFRDAIEQLKRNPYCQNCGCTIKTWLFPKNNIAHLLNKSKYKSVMTNPYNFVFLCDGKDNNVDFSSCHYDFDNNITERPLMLVFDMALAKYRLFKDEVLEEGKEKEIFENYL